MKSKESTFFWTSYTDLMTSLFFVMLALYVLTVATLRKKQIATEKELQKIREVQEATKKLPAQYFKYDESFKRYTLKEQIQFAAKSDKINESYNQYLFQLGANIKSLVNTLKAKKAKYNDNDIKYLLVIEGMASKDNYIENYQLSYLRALALYNFWKAGDQLPDPDVCEIIISGSGTGGVGRFEGTDEYKNQRFLIQIIPKIGEIKTEPNL
jgi:flagellar motor protein MotB